MLRQGNVFTPVCHSVHGEGSLSQHAPQVAWPGGSLSRRVSVQGYLCPGGLCLGGLYPRGSLSSGSLSSGVSVQLGLCPGGLCPGWSLFRGSLSRRRISVQEGGFLSKIGVSVQEGVLCPQDLCPGGSLPRGSLSQRVSVPVGLSPGGVAVQWGLCPWGSLSRGVSVQGGLCSGGLCLGSSRSGVFSRGVVCPEGSLLGRPPGQRPLPHTVMSGW